MVDLRAGPFALNHHVQPSLVQWIHYPDSLWHDGYNNSTGLIIKVVLPFLLTTRTVALLVSPSHPTWETHVHSHHL